MKSLEGKVALVTGAASGIGQAVAGMFHQNGAKLVLADINQAGVEAEASRLDGSLESTLAIPVDVTDPAQVGRMIASIKSRFGGLDVLVHSAGVGLQKSFLDTNLEDWNRLLTINLTGTFICGQACAAAMKENGYGRIVFLASTAGERGGSGRAAYGASKGGIIALTKVMAVELANDGITVNALAPGGIETELVRKMHTAATRKAYVGAMAIQRYGTPEEVAHGALYFASEGARYVTGEIHHIDGGFSAAGIMIRDD